MKPHTEEGAIVGTVAYMSPEQAEGKKVDARSDIFSFGSVLYEMVSGRRAFSGETKVSTLSAVLHQEPPPLEDAPPELDRIIRRCLRKDPARRSQHMADVKLALADLKEESDPGTLVTVAPRRRARVSRWAIAALAVGVLAVASVAFWWLRPPATLDAPVLTQLTRDTGLASTNRPRGAQPAVVLLRRVLARRPSDQVRGGRPGTPRSVSGRDTTSGEFLGFLGLELESLVPGRDAAVRSLSS